MRYPRLGKGGDGVFVPACTAGNPAILEPEDGS